MNDPKLDPKLSREARRVLVAIYRLIRGRSGAEVDQDAIAEELQSEALLDLTEAEFAVYEEKVRAEIASAGGDIKL